MRLEEFIELQKSVNIGEEISFEYKNDRYWISQNPGKCYLTRVSDSYTQEFNSPKELFEKATIDGRTLSELYLELD
ncbi:hypothetical protein [Halalkalibacter lacteus]|uniref:hypothetical protein n=1 Tax=Halalkalibacter lacteus TaxID=3090663 RepID=UPI002FC8E80D